MLILWIVLIIIAVSGIFFGMYYFFKPEIVVVRRMKKQKIPIEDKDPSFQKWLQEEFEKQVVKTRKIGKVFVIFESVWLLIILILFYHYLSGR